MSKIEKSDKSNKVIRHLVFSGGGQNLLSFYGVVKQAMLNSYIKFDDLKSMYGTSAGAIIIVIIALNIEWDIVDDFFIKRPWQKLFNLSLDNFVDIYQRKGFFNPESIFEIVRPLLKCKEYNVDITLGELYEKTRIDLHIFTTELNSFKCVDLSHSTHPTWRVLDAVYASSCVPFLFSPMIKDEECYVDGGFTKDFAINDALALYDKEEILAIKKQNNNAKNLINSDSNIIEFTHTCFERVFKAVVDKEYQHIKNTIFVPGPPVSMQEILHVTYNEDVRKEMIDYGQSLFDEYKELDDSIPA